MRKSLERATHRGIERQAVGFRLQGQQLRKCVSVLPVEGIACPPAMPVAGSTAHVLAQARSVGGGALACAGRCWTTCRWRYREERGPATQKRERDCTYAHAHAHARMCTRRGVSHSRRWFPDASQDPEQIRWQRRHAVGCNASHETVTATHASALVQTASAIRSGAIKASATRAMVLGEGPSPKTCTASPKP